MSTNGANEQTKEEAPQTQTTKPAPVGNGEGLKPDSFLDPKKKDTNLAPPEPAVKHTYDLSTNTWQHFDVYVQLNPSAVDQGCMRTVFQMRDLSLEKDKQECVAKMSKNPKDDREVYQLEVKMQAKCSLLAKQFNRYNPPLPIEFLECYIIECKRRKAANGKGGLYLICEPKLNGTYQKHSNNFGYVDAQTKLTPQAFSHFTFHYARGQMLVCDIQGVGETYTDPQIHSNTVAGWVYGKGDFGQRGIRKFFSTHKCNAVCGMLSLPVPSREGGLPPLHWPMINNVPHDNDVDRMLELRPGTQAVPDEPPPLVVAASAAASLLVAIVVAAHVYKVHINKLNIECEMEKHLNRNHDDRRVTATTSELIEQLPTLPLRHPSPAPRWSPNSTNGFVPCQLERTTSSGPPSPLRNNSLSTPLLSPSKSENFQYPSNPSFGPNVTESDVPAPVRTTTWPTPSGPSAAEKYLRHVSPALNRHRTPSLSGTPYEMTPSPSPPAAVIVEEKPLKSINLSIDTSPQTTNIPPNGKITFGKDFPTTPTGASQWPTGPLWGKPFPDHYTTTTTYALGSPPVLSTNGYFNNQGVQWVPGWGEVHHWEGREDKGPPPFAVRAQVVADMPSPLALGEELPPSSVPKGLMREHSGRRLKNESPQRGRSSRKTTKQNSPTQLEEGYLRASKEGGELPPRLRSVSAHVKSLSSSFNETSSSDFSNNPDQNSNSSSFNKTPLQLENQPKPSAAPAPLTTNNPMKLTNSYSSSNIAGHSSFYTSNHQPTYMPTISFPSTTDTTRPFVVPTAMSNVLDSMYIGAIPSQTSTTTTLIPNATPLWNPFPTVTPMAINYGSPQLTPQPLTSYTTMTVPSTS